MKRYTSSSIIAEPIAEYNGRTSLYGDLFQLSLGKKTKPLAIWREERVHRVLSLWKHGDVGLVQ